MLLIYNNQELRELGGKIVNVIHDEVVIEVPAENYKRAGEILSAMMEKAGSFLPFGIRCDVENSYRWYGLEYPCPFPQPKSWDYMTEDEVRWVQYHLFECEYVLPVFKDADGNKPEGIAAKGVNGVVSKEYEFAISDYCKKYQITKDEFFEHIHTKVDSGIVPQRKITEDNR